MAATLQSMRIDDEPRSRGILTEACAEEDGRACYQLGLMWGNGEDGPADHGQARRYVARACELGVREACDFLPMMK
jgi:TPR repeat protein